MIITSLNPHLRTLTTPDRLPRLSHQPIALASFQLLLPNPPPLLVETPPLLPLDRLPLLRHLALKLLPLPRHPQQRRRRVRKPGRRRCLRGLVRRRRGRAILERHADRPDGVEREVARGGSRGRGMLRRD